MKSRTVLVVDDEPELLQLVITYLKKTIPIWQSQRVLVRKPCR